MFKSKLDKIREKLLNISKEKKEMEMKPKGMRSYELKNSLINFITFRRLVKYTILTNFFALGYYLFKYNDKRYDLSMSRYLSRKVGFISQLKIPVFMRKHIFNFYCYFYNVNTDDILDQNFENYKTLNEFFIRKIKVRKL